MNSGPTQLKSVHGTAAAQSPRAASREANYALGVLSIIYVLNYADRGIFSLLLDSIKKDFRVSDTAMGLIAGFGFVLFYSLLGLPIARWADRFNRRFILTAGLAVWSVMTCLSGLAAGPWQLAFTRLGVGAGEACGIAPSHSMLSDMFPKEELPRALSILTAGSSVGIFVGSLLGGYVSQYYGWRWAFAAAGLPGIGVAILFRLTVKEPVRGAMEGPQADTSLHSVMETLRFLFSQVSFVYITIGGTLMGITLYAFNIWSPAFLHRVHHLNNATIGLLQGGVAALFGVAGVLIGGFFAERLGRRDIRWRLIVPAIASIASCPVSLLFLFLHSLPGALVCWGLSTMCIFAYAGPIYAVYQTVSMVRMRALASATFLFLGSLLGLGAGSALIGFVSTQLSRRFGEDSIRYSMIFPSVLGLFAGVFFWIGSRYLAADSARASSEPSPAAAD
ncbi:MAG: MFS transporter [Acidobacteriota bacterium]|nr:MFS transporter [Acidobacteriota bacterium]